MLVYTVDDRCRDPTHDIGLVYTAYDRCRGPSHDIGLVYTADDRCRGPSHDIVLVYTADDRCRGALSAEGHTNIIQMKIKQTHYGFDRISYFNFF